MITRKGVEKFVKNCKQRYNKARKKPSADMCEGCKYVTFPEPGNCLCERVCDALRELFRKGVIGAVPCTWAMNKHHIDAVYREMNDPIVLLMHEVEEAEEDGPIQ